MSPRLRRGGAAPADLLDQRCQSSRVRVAAHHDHGFCRPALRAGEVSHPQVTVRGQPAVQRDLALAGTFPTFASAEVEEVGGDRLLRLVRLVTDEDDDTR